ncbi:MAG: chorismate pyruvate-lyase family protein [Archaeoglobaceae archaeon]|nr:chorismate pyruvate-lyase family protein [Archaeoglobaceae archaeon]MDW8128037.1 chorismate pyruvate-lyase family protein [Archaeoglobaceae archaeon]
MNPIHRILLTTDGSITAIIEAYTQKSVEVETVEQKVVLANAEIARALKISEGEEVNYRVVYLKVGSEIYAKAISYTPLKRLEDSFKEDLMRADIPIGKILKKHNIEARREINWGKVVSNIEMANEFGVNKPLILVRNYNIIHKGEILMNITEFFPMERFEPF